MRKLLILLALCFPFSAQAQEKFDARNIKVVQTTLNDATETTDEIFMEDKCILGLHVGTVVTTNITATCAETDTASSGSFQTVADSSGVTVTFITGLATDDAIDLTVDGKPLCGFIYCKLVATVDQTTDRTDWFVILGN